MSGVTWGLVYCRSGLCGSPPSGFASSSKLFWACSPGGGRLLGEEAEARTACWSTVWNNHMPYAVDQSESPDQLPFEGGKRDTGRRRCRVTLPSGLDKVKGLVCDHVCKLQDYRELANNYIRYTHTPSWLHIQANNIESQQPFPW